MTVKEFELIRQAGIEKWEKPAKIKTIEKAKEWWVEIGEENCSFCFNFKDYYCAMCSLKRGNKRGCIPDFKYLSNMFVIDKPKPTIERFHKKRMAIIQKIKKSRYLKRFKDIELKGVSCQD